MTLSPVESPRVSVVVGVYNGEKTVQDTLDSLLAQEGVSFEIIIVNDGSKDGTPAMLDAYAARDNRVRVIHQENTGLTRALVRGCAVARGVFIARQDADETARPERLAWQAAFLDAHPEAVMTACGVRVVGEEGEFLYDIRQHGDELQQGLNRLSAAEVAGPSHHGCVMFRRSTYEAVGGYRPAFRVAQDLDLWLRFAEVGKCLAIPDVLCQTAWRLGSISHLRRKEQLRTTEVLVECARARRTSGGDASVIARWEAQHVRPVRRRSIRRLEEARYYYFLGGALRRRDPGRARAYYTKTLQSWPLFLKAWVWLIVLRVQPKTSPR